MYDVGNILLHWIKGKYLIRYGKGLLTRGLYFYGGINMVRYYCSLERENFHFGGEIYYEP